MTGNTRKATNGRTCNVTVKRERLERLLQREASPVATPAVRASPPFTLSEARALSMRLRWTGTAYEDIAAIYSRDAVNFSGTCSPSAR